MPNPYVMSAVIGGGQALANIFGRGEEKKLQKQMRQVLEWKFGRGQELFNRFDKMIKSGHAINEGAKTQAMSNFSRSLGPMLGKMAANYSRFSGLSSPEIQGAIARDTIAPMAQFRTGLDMLDMQQLQQLREALMRYTYSGG